MRKSATLIIAALLSLSEMTTSAFAPTRWLPAGRRSHDCPAKSTALSASDDRESESFGTSTRRQILTAAAATLVSPAAPAHATYSAYTRREEDWEQRRSRDEIKYSTAKALRSQLAEIAPQNTEQSRLFCPNGPSAAVSPLMENRCGDQLAAPSVFGRTEDALGNSIPGFSEGYSFSKASGADVGGMPDYGFTTNGRRGK